MIFDIVQTETDYITEKFAIRDRSGMPIGAVQMQGSYANNTLHIEGFFLGQTFSMRYGKKWCKDVEGKKTHPYGVWVNDVPQGAVFEWRESLGFLKGMFVHKLVLKGLEYVRYPIAFGEAGGKHPIYHGDHQSALIETDAVIRDGLYSYHVYAEDAHAGLCAVLFSCYMFERGAYQPGKKVAHSVVKRCSYTKDELLLEKYRPAFKEMICQQDDDTSR